MTLLTDFGLEDDFAGTCRGVMKRIAPDVELIDITHGIPPQHVLQGALVLANTLPYMPTGVHVAIVDPGVGSERKPIALRGGDDRIYVGPDNGLLLVAADRFGGVAEAVEIAEAAYMLERISHTFHGRDIFSPAAAHLARGVDIAELGPGVEPDSLARLEVPRPEVGERRIRACCLYVDRFGNMQLNLTRSDLQRLGAEPGTQVELELASVRYYAVAARTFTDARDGEIILYEDAYENIAVAITDGNAAEMFSIRPGQQLSIRVL